MHVYIYLMFIASLRHIKNEEPNGKLFVCKKIKYLLTLLTFPSCCLSYAIFLAQNPMMNSAIATN